MAPRARRQTRPRDLEALGALRALQALRPLRADCTRSPVAPSVAPGPCGPAAPVAPGLPCKLEMTEAASFAFLPSGTSTPGFTVFDAWMPSTRCEFAANSPFAESPREATASTTRTSLPAPSRQPLGFQMSPFGDRRDQPQRRSLGSPPGNYSGGRTAHPENTVNVAVQPH